MPSVLSLLPGAPRIRRKVIDAIYTEGALHPVDPIDLPDGPVPITVLPSGAAVVRPAEAELPAGGFRSQGSHWAEGDSAVAGNEAKQSQSEPAPAPQVRTGAARSAARLAWVLFGLALLIYAVTRLWAIERFPIYFFADEAVQPVWAQDLLARGFRDAQGHLLPIYVEAAGNRWTPLLSLYIHAISVALFGKSVLVTRATVALVSLLAAASVSLILKLVFKMRYWWIGALLMAVAPSWFLHSRTGFETVLMSSFFACFLGFYLLYRTRSPRYLFAAILCGGLTFYTYSVGQMIMVSVGAVLALSDLRYHLKHWRTTLPGLALIALLALPLLRFRATTPEFMATTLRTMDSYWFHDLSLAQKLEQFIGVWVHGLSPAYWFIPGDEILIRHRMVGYGNLSVWLLPFFAIGVGWCLWRIKSPAHRAVLLTALVTPMGAALLADVGITRVLAFTVPASLLIALGLDALIKRMTRLPDWLGAGVLFLGLSAASIGMLRDALVHGPLWSQDYGLYGMQYGASQLFEEAIPEYLRSHPDGQVLVTSTWANGADSFLRFFLSEEEQARVQLSTVDYYMIARRELTPDMLFVMTPDEYQRAVASQKFKSVEVLDTLPYPDESVGFYFAHLAYADNLDDLIAQEREERSRPVQAQVVIDGQEVQLLHSQLDMGAPPNLFDSDHATLVRGLEANPLVFDFGFPQPRPISGLIATFASMDFTLKVSLYDGAEADPVIYEQTFRDQPPDPTVSMVFERAPAAVTRLRLEVLQLNPGVDVHIHVRELVFK